jgi:hypothetical protein
MSHPVKAVKDFWSDDNDLIKVFLFRKQILAELSRACPKQSKSLARGDAAHHCFGKTAGGKVEPLRERKSGVISNDWAKPG